MGTPRRGDLVAFAENRRYLYGLIQTWSGNPANLACVITSDYRIRFRLVDERMVDPVEAGLLLSAEAAELRDGLIAWADTKPGKQSLRDSRGPSEGTVDRHGKVHRKPEPITPSQGTGFPHYADPPLRLADRYPAWLSASFARYLDMRPKYEATLARLAQRHPNHYAVYVEHVHGGKRLVDIAAQLGITPDNARYRQHQARTFLRQQLQEERAV